MFFYLPRLVRTHLQFLQGPSFQVSLAPFRTFCFSRFVSSFSPLSVRPRIHFRRCICLWVAHKCRRDNTCSPDFPPSSCGTPDNPTELDKGLSCIAVWAPDNNRFRRPLVRIRVPRVCLSFGPEVRIRLVVYTRRWTFGIRSVWCPASVFVQGRTAASAVSRTLVPMLVLELQ